MLRLKCFAYANVWKEKLQNRQKEYTKKTQSVSSTEWNRFEYPIQRFNIFNNYYKVSQELGEFESLTPRSVDEVFGLKPALV